MNDNYAYIAELDYFNELLDKLSSGKEFPLSGLDYVMNDRIAMIKLGISTRLAADPVRVICNLDKLKLQCCEILIRGYQVRETLLGLSLSELGNNPSPEMMLKTVVTCLLNNHMEDLLIFYRQILNEEGVLSNDFNLSLN